MGAVTLQVLDGSDRGRFFEQVPTPITIGREEGNSVQLNDERISRYHLKIQEDHDKIVLTDLESTNGTKVNGEDIQLRILRYGDLIAVGRSVLLYGSRDQIAGRLADLRGTDSHPGLTTGSDDGNGKDASLEFELDFAQNPDVSATLHALQPPELPERLTPGQAAQLSELLEYLHIRIRRLLDSVKPEATAKEEQQDRVLLDLRQWQSLLELQSRLAGYLRKIGEPNHDE